jgi:hypothetical protein
VLTGLAKRIDRDLHLSHISDENSLDKTVAILEG